MSVEPLNSAQAEEEEADGRRHQVAQLPTSHPQEGFSVRRHPHCTPLHWLIGRFREMWGKGSDCPFQEEYFGVGDLAERNKYKVLTIHEEEEVTEHLGRLGRARSPGGKAERREDILESIGLICGEGLTLHLA